MQKMEFSGAQGDMLAARLDEPEGDIRAYALFAHCFSCSKDMVVASRISKALNEREIAVLRFDFTGLGESDGEFCNTNFTSNIQDLVQAANAMRDHAAMEAPSILIGHSLGGAAALASAHEMPEVKAVATIGAPADASHVTHHFEDKRAEIMEHGEAEVSLVGRPFKIKRQFIEDLEAQKMDEHIAALKRSLLVMHSPVDETVGIHNAERIFKMAKHPKSFVSLGRADHLISGKEDAEYAARVIAAWASRYVGY